MKRQGAMGRVPCSPCFGMPCARRIIRPALTEIIVSRRRHHRHSPASDRRPFGGELLRGGEGPVRLAPRIDLLRFFNGRLHAASANALENFARALIISEKSYKVGLSVLLEEPPMSSSRPRVRVLMSAAPESSREAERMAAASSPARHRYGRLCERSRPSSPPARHS